MVDSEPQIAPQPSLHDSQESVGTMQVVTGCRIFRTFCKEVTDQALVEDLNLH